VSRATRERLARLLDADDPDPAEANLLVAAEADPGLDAGAVLARIDAIALRARERGVVPALRDEGLRGDREEYDDPRNSFLHCVLERRRGLPIALATLTLAVARRVGAPMAGIGLPGHFVVADLGSGVPEYLDAFDDWRRMSAAECARAVARTAGVSLRPEHLEPVGARAITARTLANLRGAYLRRRRLADALWTAELAEIVTPGAPGVAVDRVTLLTAAGRYAEAEEAAIAYLAGRVPPRERAGMRARLAAARALRRRMS